MLKFKDVHQSSTLASICNTSANFHDSDFIASDSPLTSLSGEVDLALAFENVF